jgi:heptosyltransferase-1
VTETGNLRVLITRLSHIGDCVLTLPLACAIKDHQPDAFVAWIVEKPADQLLAGHRAIDKLLVVPRGFLKSPSALIGLRKRLRKLRCNIALDPQSLSKSAVLARLSGAPRRVGFKGRHGREIAPQLNNECIEPTSTHLLDRTLELLPALGIETPRPVFDLPVATDADTTTAEFIATSHLGCGFVVLNPGASWPSKQWAPRKFARVARHLGEKHRIPSLVTWSGEVEKAWAEQIVERSGGHALLAPSTNLRELASLLRCAHFFVGSDTGPLHVAAAVGTPCIGLYGPTRPEDSGAYGTDHLAVQAFHQTGNRRTRKSSDIAMSAIDAERVIDACEEQIHRLGVEADRHAA